MIFKIKNRFTGNILFSLETENLKLCVEAAVNDGAYLCGAKLIGDRPIIQIFPIGSRSDFLTAFITDRGLKLQPAFVEWMMGYPKNYTNLKLPTEWHD